VADAAQLLHARRVARQVWQEQVVQQLQQVVLRRKVPKTDIRKICSIIWEKLFLCFSQQRSF